MKLSNFTFVIGRPCNRSVITHAELRKLYMAEKVDIKTTVIHLLDLGHSDMAERVDIKMTVAMNF